MKEQDDITAKELYDTFRANKAEAEREYGRRMMKISGYAVYVGPDMFGLPCVELSEKKEGPGRAICLLSIGDYLKLRKISKGDEVIMEGEIRSLYDKGQTVVVKHSRIIERNTNSTF